MFPAFRLFDRQPPETQGKPPEAQQAGTLPNSLAAPALVGSDVLDLEFGLSARSFSGSEAGGEHARRVYLWPEVRGRRARRNPCPDNFSTATFQNPRLLDPEAPTQQARKLRNYSQQSQTCPFASGAEEDNIKEFRGPNRTAKALSQGTPKTLLAGLARPSKARSRGSFNDSNPNRSLFQGSDLKVQNFLLRKRSAQGCGLMQRMPCEGSRLLCVRTDFPT